ncbi:alpha/beta fold hydrolase [Arthrobacter sp. Br18]|uniref:lipase family alpha/beta hydrolase n=1 Tax=Arthrobacter sp. Br18 TaxID=1312954 RepID=UPI000478C2AE|nr:alpha/beta fold hydrolase [Arthrobacter sp. Br18]
MKFRLSAVLATAAIAATSLTGLAPASADALDVSPPGANDWSCKPSAEHPYPVVLVPGTFESMLKNWSTLSPVLKEQGYCVFALNYGTTNGIDATGPVADSAGELATFVNEVLKATGTRKVDVVGHSQGGMMPRYYLGFLGGAKKVNHLVGIAPSNHGTEGVSTPAPDDLPVGTDDSGVLCQACADQEAGSPFLAELNSIGDTVTGPAYTVITTKYDEVVTPYQSQFLSGPAKHVTNILLQDKCPLNLIEHDQAPIDPAVHQLVSHALSKPGPANPSYQPRCL